MYLSLHDYFFFFKDTATTEIYTLSLHDALPIWRPGTERVSNRRPRRVALSSGAMREFSSSCSLPSALLFSMSAPRDRKSTRLNSSHQIISYAVFCLKKKK